MTSGIIDRRFGERLARVETRLNSHDRQIQDIERDIEAALGRASESRRYMHEKIEAVDKRINRLVVGGLVGLIGILVNAIISIVFLYFQLKVGK